LSRLEDKLGQIPDIKTKERAQRIYSIPTFVILDECKSKLTEDMPPSRIETIAPIVGAILIAAKFWDSFLNWGEVGKAAKNLQNIADQSQDSGIKTALSNTLRTASRRLQQSNPALQEAPVPPAIAEGVGATVLAALASKYVHSPEVQNALKIQGQSQQQEGPQRLRLITDSSITTKITNAVGKQEVIPRFDMIQDPKGGGVVKNIKRMINAFAEYMAESWEAIENQIKGDIREGRLSDPQRKIQQALDEIDDAWHTLLNRMQAAGWKEYPFHIGLEKVKIEGIKRELEQLIDACFELLEAWKAAEKPQKGALNIEALLFSPLGLPALKAALRTLPPSIPGGATTRKVAQKKEREAAQKKEGKIVQKKAEETAQKKEGEARKRLRYQRPPTGPVRLVGTVRPWSGPMPPHSAEGKETPEKTLQEEIGRAINFIRAGQADDAIKAVANATMILRDVARQKTQPQGAPPASRREAEAYLGAALQKLRDAIRLGPGSDGFKANLQQANSLLQDALDVLSNPTAGSTPYLGRKLLLLTKTLSSVPSTARSHRQRAKNEDILEKETI
jgi:hypothetical protein